MRNRKTQRQLKKNDKVLDRNNELGYRMPKEMNDFNPYKRAYGSFESNKR